MTSAGQLLGIERLVTGIEGFDLLAEGGLPKGRTILVSGTSGSGKTVLAVQFLAEGIMKAGEPGVFVAFEEAPADICRNMVSFGWDLMKWQEEGMLAFVDASPEPEQDCVVAGAYDLGALLARVENAVNKVGAKRVALDSLGAVYARSIDHGTLRSDIFRLTMALKNLGVTSLITAERTQEYGDIARFGVEEFVVDNVVVLRNILESGKRRRTMEILKLRGAGHQKGEYSFTITPGAGVLTIPLSVLDPKKRATGDRITSGNQVLDQMCGGGYFRDSVILVSGATGTGKTLTVTEFLAGGAANGGRCLMVAFEESREQVFRNAIGWGVDFERMERDGRLMVLCRYPETAGLEDHLVTIRETINEFKPDRVAVDSLSALERVATAREFGAFVVGLTSFIMSRGVTGLLTATTFALVDSTSVTMTHVSTINDTIILLRYVEVYGEMHRGITVLKMRGSAHDKQIRQFSIDGSGMHIGRPYRNVTGILTGSSICARPAEAERIGELSGE